MSIADKKSSLVQIAQATLDEATQSVKVAISVDGSPVDETNPLPVVIDSQNIVVDVALDKDNDSVTAWQGGGAWAVTNTHITQAVATSANQVSTNTKLDTLISQTDGVEGSLSSIDTKVATAAKQDTQITELQAIKGHVDGVESSLTSIDSKVSALAVIGAGAATSALRVQLSDESLSALENINVTVTNTALEITNDAGNPIPVSNSYFSYLQNISGYTASISNIVNSNNYYPYYSASIAVGGMSSDGVHRVLSTNTSGHINIADGGNSITVDGTVAATQSGTWNINNISGTVSLPTGASTSANQSTIIGHLDGVEGLLTTIDTDTGSILTSVQLLDDVVATDGAAALTKAYQVAGTDGTNAQIISTNASGHVNIADGGNSITVDGTVTANAGTGNFTVVQGTATNLKAQAEAYQGGTAVGAANPLQVSLANTGANATAVKVDGSAVTQPISGTVTVTQATAANLNATVTGTVTANLGTIGAASTAANQSTIITSLQLIDDIITSDNTAIGTTKLAVVGGFDGTNAQYLSTNTSGHVNIADGGNSITVDGTVTANVQNNITYRNRVRLDYVVTNVTSAAWVQLLSTVGATAIKEIEIFDSSGETLELGVGAAGSEVVNSYVFPGGNGRIPMQIAANARLSVRAVSATANSGEIIINLYG